MQPSTTGLHDAVAYEDMVILIGSFQEWVARKRIKVPENATVDMLVTKLALDGDGFAGFLTVPLTEEDDDMSGEFTDGPRFPQQSSLATLAEGQGLLLEPGKTLSSYNIMPYNSKDVILYAVFDDPAKQPVVFEEDMRRAGFAAAVLRYVKVHEEPRDVVHARSIFRSPLLPWLQEDETRGSQTVKLCSEGEFEGASRKMITMQLEVDGQEFLASCTNMAGHHVCSIRLPQGGLIAELKSSLCEKMRWAALFLWEGSEQVCETRQLSKCSALVGEIFEHLHVSGYYHFHQSEESHDTVHSSSGTSTTCMLVLERGKAGLLHRFQGDYKQASELQQLVMHDAQWCVESQNSQKQVRVGGLATVDRFWRHERYGYDRIRLKGCKCYVEVTIPLEQLEQGQKEELHQASTPWSGWLGGSAEYKAVYFMPATLLKVLRIQPSEEDDSKPFYLQQSLNPCCLSDYPHSMLTALRRRIQTIGHSKLDQATLDEIRFFRQQLSGRAEDVAIDKALQLEEEHMEAAKLQLNAELVRR